ncbi:MAG: hypothetical protein IH987_20580 [Planctomycetes bacterium]|nr:hypothetical protein [Planctomycetota bacterium]
MPPPSSVSEFSRAFWFAIVSKWRLTATGTHPSKIARLGRWVPLRELIDYWEDTEQGTGLSQVDAANKCMIPYHVLRKSANVVEVDLESDIEPSDEVFDEAQGGKFLV